MTGCEIKGYKATWNENGTEKVTNFVLGGLDLTTPHFYMVADGEIYEANPPQPVGFYEIHFTFYNSVTQDESAKVFSCTEYINVFENLQTNTWVNDAKTSYISGGNFTLTPDIIEKQGRHKFYVDQANGNSTNEGSYFSPLDSVKTAVSKICADNDGDPYKIILLSDVEEDSSEASYIYDAAKGEFGSYIEIVPESTLNLTIEGYGTEKRTVNANRSSSNTGNVLYISENANVTLDNLIITGAYSVDLYGGGIRNVGELHIKNCDITGNTAAYGGGIALYEGSPRLYFENTQQIKIQGNEASVGGGGLYLAHGTVSFNNTAEILISENHASSGQGGGIFSNISIDIPDSSMVTVSKNESVNGSGIYFDSTSGTLNLSSDVNIENNTAINSGGGIYLMAGTLNIDGATLSENSAKAGGGISTRSSLTINKALITKNEATGEGGAIYSETTINSITLGEDVFFTKNQANTGSVIYSAGIITNLNLKCTFDDDGDNSFYDAEKNTSVADTHLLKLTGTSGTTKLNFYSTFNMNVDNSVYIATDEDDSGIATQIHIAESLANFDSKKIKIDPSCYPPEALGIQVFFVKSGLTAAEEYEKFSIVNDSSGNKYGINDSGKIIPVYTDWDTLVAAVTNITTGTATVTDFEIGSNMTMTRVLLSECPVRLYARKNYTLTLAEDCKSGVIKPSAELTIEGVDSAKITFDGNSVTSTASFISLDEMTNATFNKVKFTNFKSSSDGSVVSSISGGYKRFTNCEFISNEASGDGGAVCINGMSAFTFTDCTFESNSSSSSGGGLAIKQTSDEASINSCTFTSNHAESEHQGGGIYVFEGKCSINGITMNSNSAGSSSEVNDIFLNTSISNAALYLGGSCKIPVVYSSVGSSALYSPNIIKITDLNTASSIGLKMSLYTLSKDVIQSSDGTTDISSLSGCFSVVDSGYSLTPNASGTGFYIQSN